MNSQPLNALGFSRSPYDLDESERAEARKEAEEFAATQSWDRIPPGEGTYRQKRPGLGVTLHGYHVDCSVTPHKRTADISLSAWRVDGEARFGDSLKKTN